QQEFPHLDALRKELASEPDFQFASVSCWQGIESDIDQLREETVSFLQQQRSDLPTYYDPQAVTRIAIMDAMRQNGFGYPMTILLDRSGVIRGAWRGYAPKMEVDMEQVTRDLLAAGKK
ncbi:MAG TPA: hypothetical protein VL096_02930, partial [Pirellulaceae bacterium]|nr:hypothetical protein [Pirellulaceae bacterium]